MGRHKKRGPKPKAATLRATAFVRLTKAAKTCLEDRAKRLKTSKSNAILVLDQHYELTKE